jgi:hypothetical protein
MTEQRGRVLIGCPTYAGKEYCLDAWIAACRSQTYDPKFLYTVDNTRVSQAYFDLIRSKGVDCTHIQPWRDWDRTFRRCWELILERAKALDCYWILSVEADNTPAPEALDIMVNAALYANAHLVTHAYPMHQSAAKASGLTGKEFYYHELGCMLMSRSLLERAIRDFEEYGNIVAAIFGTESRYLGGYIKMTNRFTVGHLDGYHQSFDNLGPSEIPGLICPTPQMPADYGTDLPAILQGQT